VGPTNKVQLWQYTFKTLFFRAGPPSMPNTPSSQLQLHPKLAPTGVSERSCSSQSWSHAKQTLYMPITSSGYPFRGTTAHFPITPSPRKVTHQPIWLPIVLEIRANNYIHLIIRSITLLVRSPPPRLVAAVAIGRPPPPAALVLPHV
jgi:hypothetical protein